MQTARTATVLASAIGFALSAALGAQTSSIDSLASRIDPYVAKSRVIVMTDIANEPDDQMSMVRFLVYANRYDVEGLIASTSTWMRRTVRPDVILTLLDAYALVQPNLERHEKGFPSLHYIAMPSTPDGQQYYLATWTGTSGDRFYKNAPGADFSTFTDAWVTEHIRSKGPLGKLYPFPCCIHEGDTPAFLGLVDNGLASFMSPTYGGWGGRYVWRQFYGETRPSWTQGGVSYPGNDNSRDAVEGSDGKTYTSDQATIWRWRTAFQHDFAARMDWTVKDVREGNHNPVVVVNGQAGKAPVMVDAVVGTPVLLDATGTHDPDGQTLTYNWFFYPEAGTGIPGRPVVTRGLRPVVAAGQVGAGSIPSAGAGGPPEPQTRVIVENAHEVKATVLPRVAGIAHVIVAVEDSGTPSLTSYRRVILNIKPRP
ncbi:MAG TPA: nucleoside hydrolase-like domain-containing protein [Gemmatimonadaceae bacterium]|nr:nucleoside hydrolase-like domain-containing protein [Gemmatimonadaceae bacterium]